MKLTGAQLHRIADIADGADVALTSTKGQSHVDMHRLEDDLVVRVHADGTTTTLREAVDNG